MTHLPVSDDEPQRTVEPNRMAFAEVEQQRRQLASLLDATPDHVFLLDLEGHFTYGNAAAAAIIAAASGAPLAVADRSFFLGKSGGELGFPAEFLVQFEAQQARARSGEIAVAETPFPTPGGPRIFEYILSPLRDESGKVVGVAGITRDVHDRKLAEEERKGLLEKLQTVDEMKTRFFANVSHEFRTPITLILGPLEDELAEPAARLPPMRHARLATAHRNSLRLLRLVNSLLDFTRLQAGGARAHYVPTDLAALTANIASAFRPSVEKAGLAYVITCPPARAPVYVDREMWEKILLNLLSNAFKYTQKGRIEIRLGAVGEQVELTVEDSGCGIPDSELPNLFSRFHRVAGAEGRSFEGTGIGLALVQELVKLHGGTVRVASTVGAGSVFTVSLPFGKEHLAADRIGEEGVVASAGNRTESFAKEALPWLREGEEPVAETASANAKGTGERPVILVADDNADLRDYLQNLLCTRFEVVAVSDGEAAWQAINERRPDLVLSDVMMPRLDGFGLLARVRTDPSTRSLPVVLLSARAGEESSIGGLEAGADDYVVKPFSARELVARVQTHLEMARFRREKTLELAHANRLLEQKVGELETLNVDLSERARQIADLTALEHQKDEFISVAAHELRTPITVIKGFLELLLRISDPLTAQQRAMMAAEGRGVARLERLVDDLLAMTHVREGQLRLDRDPLDLAELVREAVVAMQVTAESHVLRCAAAGPVPVLGDRIRLDQVLSNLIHNAIHYSSEGPIDISLAIKSAEAVVSVKDCGLGIPIDRQARIFERFFRAHTETPVSRGGLGLGLFVSRAIVERHGGRIWFESEPDRGSTFHFSMPLREAPEARHGS